MIDSKNGKDYHYYTKNSFPTFQYFFKKEFSQNNLVLDELILRNIL